MKKLIFIFIAICSISYAQIDRTNAPEAGNPPVIEIGEYQEFKLKNGLHVILVENHKLPVVSFQLSTDYTPFAEKDKIGMSEFVSEMIGAGTTSKSKAELDEELDYIGASFYSSGIDGFYASSLKKHQTKLLNLMSDVIFNPNFPEEEFEKIKKQYISGLEAEKSSPDAISSNISSLINYGKNHPYGELATEETLNNITIEDVKNLCHRELEKDSEGNLKVINLANSEQRDYDINGEMTCGCTGDWTGARVKPAHSRFENKR